MWETVSVSSVEVQHHVSGLIIEAGSGDFEATRDLMGLRSPEPLRSAALAMRDAMSPSSALSLALR